MTTPPPACGLSFREPGWYWSGDDGRSYKAATLHELIDAARAQGSD